MIQGFETVRSIESRYSLSTNLGLLYMITTEEAKRTQIGGWDVYLSDHIMYVNDVNRIQSAARLCEQAFMIVHDSYVFKLKKQRESEVMEWKKWISSGGILGKDPTPSSEAAMIQLRN